MLWDIQVELSSKDYGAWDLELKDQGSIDSEKENTYHEGLVVANWKKN